MLVYVNQSSSVYYSNMQHYYIIYHEGSHEFSVALSHHWL